MYFPSCFLIAVFIFSAKCKVITDPFPSNNNSKISTLQKFTFSQGSRIGKALVLVPASPLSHHGALRPLTSKATSPGSSIAVSFSPKEGCCRPVMNGMCADGTEGTPRCGGLTKKCNIFGCNCGVCRTGWYVTVYEHADFRGTPVGIVGGNSCRNLNGKYCYKDYGPTRFNSLIYDKCVETNDMISSINPYTNCVQVYEDVDCKGNFLKISPREGCTDRLIRCFINNNKTMPNWNDRISSIGPCQN